MKQSSSFGIETERQYGGVYQRPETWNPVSQKLILPAFLLSTFLGLFGVHRFYAGKIGTGIVMLLLTLSFFGVLVTAIWNFIDWIMIICGAFRDGDGRKISQWT